MITGVDKGNLERYEESEQIIEFEKFLGEFKTENEINAIDLQSLLDTDFDKLSELKAKAEEFTDATSSLLEDKLKNSSEENVNTAAEEELMIFFMEKLNEMKQNEINLHIFIDNMDRVKGMSYSQNGTKIYYKKN